MAQTLFLFFLNGLGMYLSCQIDGVIHCFQPFEERMQTACKEGTLVLLRNLDPTYVSTEVEVIPINANLEKLLDEFRSSS